MATQNFSTNKSDEKKPNVVKITLIAVIVAAAVILVFKIGRASCRERVLDRV